MERDTFGQNQNASTPAVAPEQQLVHNGVNQADASVPGAAGEPGQEQPIDYAARARELEEQNQKLTGVLQNVQSWAEQRQAAEAQQARQQQIQSREQAILDRADQMPSDQARNYIAEEMRKLRDEDVQQAYTQVEYVKRAMGRPIYIDNLVKQHGLTEQDRETLLGLENPDDAARMAPYLKAQHQSYTTLQQQIDQLSRTQQANQVQGTGIGLVGGTNGPQGTVDMPTDPTERAMLIYSQLKQGTYQGR